MRLRTPPDVLAAIPYLIGYHPRDSVVVLAMRDTDLLVAARDDLPDPEEGRAGVADRATNLCAMAERVGADAVFLTAYGTAERADPTVLELMDECAYQGLRVLEALRAHDGRYWSYLCANPDCCPPGGHPDRSAASAVAAQWIMAGRVALRDRTEWEAQLREATGTERESMRRATDRATDRLIELLAGQQTEPTVAAALLAATRAAVDAAITRLRDRGPLADDEVAWLSVLVMDTEVRNQVLVRVKRAGVDLDYHRALWTEVVRRCEHDLMPAPACLLGFAAWRTGNGGLARLALERALRTNPHYPMAVTMLAVIGHGIPPTALDEPGGAWFTEALLVDDLSDLAAAEVTPRRGRRRRRRSSSRRAETPRG
jgi:hypothetical protein